MFMTRWKKRLSLFLYWAQNLPSFLIYLQNTTTLSTLLILPVCSMHVICEFCNGPSICFIRCVASGSSGHIRESAPLQLWDINRRAALTIITVFWPKFLSSSVSWIPHPKALLGIALFNPLTPKIRLSTLPSSCYTFPYRLFDQDKNPYLTSLSIFITCLLNNARILQGEVTR